MKIVSAEEMRGLDQRTIQEYGISGEKLMRIAGEGLADAVRRLASEHQLVDAPVLFVAGCGNNGGDAFVAARTLHEAGWSVQCWLAGSEGQLKGDAQTWFRHMRKAEVPFHAIKTVEQWQHAMVCGTDAEIVVDALLGTGATGDPRGLIADAVRFVDALAERALVVAVDIPSAMAVRADRTVAMGLPKTDCMQSENLDYVGNLEVVDIGIPREFIDAVEGDPDLEFIHPSDLTPLFPRRTRDTHKGAFGHVLCIGGTKGFSGAIAMASRAAARSGAGLVSAFVPETIQPVVAQSAPEVMVHSSMPDGQWTAIVAGPGMGRLSNTREQVLHLLETSTVPLVLDADAITSLAGELQAVTAARCPVILTPHPGEFAAFFGLKVEEVQQDRSGMARMAAVRLGVTVVLKGAGTIVAAPSGLAAINLTGNPGMATGGTGDVLAGVIAGLAGQGMEVFQAACAGVWLHGRAGDLAAAEGSQTSLIATDLIEKLPLAIREVSCR